MERNNNYKPLYKTSGLTSANQLIDFTSDISFDSTNNSSATPNSFYIGAIITEQEFKKGKKNE